MRIYSILCLLLVNFCPIGTAQQIKLKEIYRITINADYTRYKYVFSVTNRTPDRLNLLVDVNLLDSGKNIVDTRFMSFQTPKGSTGTDSIESNCAPGVSDDFKATASFYRLSIRDEGHHRTYEEVGNLNVPVVHKKG
jgi:hypothetical protein